MTNRFLEHALEIPGILRSEMNTLDQNGRSVLSNEEIGRIRQIYLYGSGDSFNAAVCAASAFMDLAGIPAQPLVSLDASRYVAGVCVHQPAESTLAIAISYSGEASRTLEATLALSGAGCRTLACTAFPESKIAHASWKTLPVHMPPSVNLPGVATHVVLLTALYNLAIHIAEVRKTVSAELADQLRSELFSCPDVLEQAFLENPAQAKRFAADCDRFQRVEFLASGPVRGCADFAAAKVIETEGFVASSQDVEEFAHLNFFFTHPERIPTVLIGSSSARSLIRLQEIECSLQHLGRPYWVVTDGAAFAAGRENTILLEPKVREVFSSILFSGVLAWMTAQIDPSVGGGYFRSHAGPFSEEGYATIRQSKIVL